VLIVRLGALGDIVHALPVLASLRRQWPAAAIDWLVERRHAPLLELAPDVTTRVVFDRDRMWGEHGWVRTLRALRRRQYDLVLDVQGLLKSAVLARGTGATAVYGFARGHARERLAAALYTMPVDPRGARHVVHRNLAIARAAGAAPRLEFPLRRPVPGARVAEAIAEAHGPFVLLNPGGGWPNKQWPAERFGVLAARVRRAVGWPVLVLWGPGEPALAEKVVAAASGTAQMAPETSLHDLVALIAAAGLVVAGDTGPLHIAAALGVPVVGIFGPTDPARNGPWSPADAVVSRSAACSCFHQRRCHDRRWCLADVSVEEVQEAVEGRLGAAAAAGAQR
jgi:lipopolysaccharide heptosyltransferase I